MYYANASRLLADLRAIVNDGSPAGDGTPLSWLVFDCAAIEDIDYTASTILARAVELAGERHVRFALSTVLPVVRRQLDGYGISKTLGPGFCYETPGAALDAFHAGKASG
ncbi:MAG: sodium-independent anion transporter [Trebonia sp.]